MREVIDIRVREKYASRLFDESCGTRIGDSLREVSLCLDDPRLRVLEQMHGEYRQSGGLTDVFTWSRVRREYSEYELASATLFHLIPTKCIGVSGEEYGTSYDENNACPVCGSGATQQTPLCLPPRVLPSEDLAVTIADTEIVVSARFVDIVHSQSIAGIEVSRIHHPRNGVEIEGWYQLQPDGTTLNVVPPTRVQNSYFDDDPSNEYRCQRGDLLGLNVISELYLTPTVGSSAELAFTKQYIGCRRGVIRPRRMIVVSQRLRSVLMSEGMRGFRFEVAHIVS